MYKFRVARSVRRYARQHSLKRNIDMDFMWEHDEIISIVTHEEGPMSGPTAQHFCTPGVSSFEACSTFMSAPTIVHVVLVAEGVTMHRFCVRIRFYLIPRQCIGAL